MDELHREYETPFTTFSYQATFHTPHRAMLDANSLTCDEA